MTIVVDASICVAWLIEDEQTPEIMVVLDRAEAEGLTAPSLFPYEVANVLTVAVRRRQFQRERHAQLLDAVAMLDVKLDRESEAAVLGTTSSLADRHALTVYDAAYLELAQRLRLPLATLDAALRRACGEAGVAVLP